MIFLKTQMNQIENKIKSAIEILIDIGLPRAQQNDRSGLALLALLNLKPGQNWNDASVDHKRYIELSNLFSDSKAGLVFISSFPNRSTMSKYISDIAWETEVWIADNPSHLIHFNGERFLGPY